MALIKCAECGKEVSDKAEACPGCGAPISGATSSPVSLNPTSHANVTRTGAKWEGMGFILIILGMLVGMAASPPLSTLGGTAAVIGFVVFIIGRFK